MCALCNCKRGKPVVPMAEMLVRRDAGLTRPRRDTIAGAQILNDSSDSGAKSSRGFKRCFESPCS